MAALGYNSVRILEINFIPSSPVINIIPTFPNNTGAIEKNKYKGKKYLTVELTTKALIGEIKESISDPSLWTPVEMEYSNGY